MRIGTRRRCSLIELMIVVAVVGILATLAIPKHGNTKQRAARTPGLADMHGLWTPQERFFAQSGRCADVSDSAALGHSLCPGNTALAITLARAPAGSSGSF